MTLHFAVSLQVLLKQVNRLFPSTFPIGALMETENWGKKLEYCKNTLLGGSKEKFVQRKQIIFL